MRKIPLTQGKFALVSDSDYESLVKFKWYAAKHNKVFYATRASKRVNGKQVMINMHSFIMKTPKGMETDHVDGDGLNNQRKNLRICTVSQNAMNRKPFSNNKSGLKGVYWEKSRKKWNARICFGGNRVNLGYFSSALDAYKAYCDACIKNHGEFNRLK